MTSLDWHTLDDEITEPVDVIIDDDGVHLSQDNLDGDSDAVSLSWVQFSALLVLTTEVLKARNGIIH